jgi:hypothetical protein
MIYSIVGTNREIREKGAKETSSLGIVTRYIYSEQVGELESHIDATSLFGDTVIIGCVQLGDVASSKEVLVSLLNKMKESANIFIIDEPFADIHLINKLTKVSAKLFNAKEEKIKDTSVFALCDSFAQRDKKQAWVDFINLREKGEGEAIQGALWWKFQMVWQGVLEGKKSPFSVEDCERIGGALVRSSILAHRGEKDLMEELERIVLSL